MINKTHRLVEPVLVTGAMGFIGRRLITRLINENYKVIAFDLPSQKVPLEWTGHVECIAGDISNEADVENVVKQSKTIIHLAAVVGDWGSDELHQRVTVDGTELLFKAALEHKSRVILASSIVVYGDKINKTLCHENLSLGQTFGPYSRSKQAQERLAKHYMYKGLELTVIRPANVYGAGSKPWVEDLTKEIKAGSPVLIGGGEFNAGLVHVNNVVELFIMAASHPDAIGEVYNICDEELITWKQYIVELANTINAPKPRSIPKFVAFIAATVLEKLWYLMNKENRPLLTHEALNLVGSHHRISIAKAKQELSYKPTTTFEQGMNEVKSYLKEGTRS